MNKQQIKMKIEASTKDAAAINGKIAEINGKLEARKLEIADLGGSQTETLKEIREDLQADVELGNASSTQLKDLDAKIEAAVVIDKKRDEANGAISGLGRKLEDAERDAKSANTQIMSDSIKYVLAEAEDVGAEYITAAHEVCRLFRKLQALSDLAKGYHFSYARDISKKIFIPAFLLKSHDGFNAGAGSPAVLSESLDIASGHMAANDVDQERQRLAAMGLIL